MVIFRIGNSVKAIAPAFASLFTYLSTEDTPFSFTSLFFLGMRNKCNQIYSGFKFVMAVKLNVQVEYSISHLFTVKAIMRRFLPGAWCTLTDVQFVSPKLCSCS